MAADFQAGSLEGSSVGQLYNQLISFWNKRDAESFAKLFSEQCNVTGFDGSQMNGVNEIHETLSDIFANHKTPPFTTKIREIRKLDEKVMILRAAAGMKPDGNDELDPSLNAIQTMIAIRINGVWKITLFQNTPARFDMDPKKRDELTRELQEK
ncbi:hypothetical protein BH10BAC5_BH10BAC5_15810 [soil metagenome]